MRVGAIDCGTNSLRMLILERGADGSVREVVRRLRLVRLGQGVDATGEFAAEALFRTFAALDEYARELAAYRVEKVRFVATSAARDAGNVDEFLAGVEARLGVAGDIISGVEEAELSFAGALSGVTPPPEPVLVTDIGGGSTELVIGGAAGITSAVSLDIGSVRLRERFLYDDPPTPEQLAAAAAYIDEQLDRINLSGIRGWIGVAGTVTSMAALSLGLTTYDASAIQGLVLTPAEIEQVTGHLCRTVSSDLISDLLPPLRAEIICGGALICARISARTGLNMVVSENDLLDGVAQTLLGDGHRLP